MEPVGAGNATLPDEHDRERLERELRWGNRLNVLWLYGSAEAEAALCIEGSGLELGGSLDALCGRVETLTPSAVKGALAHGDGSFDLVTAYGLAPRPAVLRELERVLRPGGLALVAVRNRWWYGRRRASWRAGPGDVGGPGLAGALRRAGFVRVHTYYAAPSLADPRTLVPAAAPVWGAETGSLLGHAGARAHMWRALAGLGLRRTLFPALVFVGEAR